MTEFSWREELQALSNDELFILVKSQGESWSRAQLIEVFEVIMTRLIVSTKPMPEDTLEVLAEVHSRVGAVTEPSGSAAQSSSGSSTSSSASLPSHVVAAELDSLCELKDGWDGDDAPPPNNHSLAVAEVLLYGMRERGFSSPAVMACVDGGVTIVYTTSKRKVVIESFNTRELTIATSEGFGKTSVLELQASREAIQEVLKIADEFLAG